MPLVTVSLATIIISLKAILIKVKMVDFTIRIKLPLQRRSKVMVSMPPYKLQLQERLNQITVETAVVMEVEKEVAKVVEKVSLSELKRKSTI